MHQNACRHHDPGQEHDRRPADDFNRTLIIVREQYHVDEHPDDHDDANDRLLVLAVLATAQAPACEFHQLTEPGHHRPGYGVIKCRRQFGASRQVQSISAINPRLSPSPLNLQDKVRQFR